MREQKQNQTRKHKKKNGYFSEKYWKTYITEPKDMLYTIKN